ncbi:hypothetical protein BH20ACT17_BH20ACT17_08820 [soil metagenome]
MLRHARWVLVLFAVSAVLAAGCGGDDSKQSGGAASEAAGGKDCKDADKPLTDAARGHVAPLKVGTDIDRVTVDVCRTSDEEATAVVIAYGMRDDSTRDIRHQMKLIKVGGLWQVTDDIDSRRCQPGHGAQEFSDQYCQ